MKWLLPNDEKHLWKTAGMEKPTCPTMFFLHVSPQKKFNCGLKWDFIVLFFEGNCKQGVHNQNAKKIKSSKAFWPQIQEKQLHPDLFYLCFRQSKRHVFDAFSSPFLKRVENVPPSLSNITRMSRMKNTAIMPASSYFSANFQECQEWKIQS